jgi:hypothetical protein
MIIKQKLTTEIFYSVWNVKVPQNVLDEYSKKEPFVGSYWEQEKLAKKYGYKHSNAIKKYDK